MNPVIQAAVAQAQASLHVPEPVAATPMGGMQLEVTGQGDVKALETTKTRPVNPTQIDGNISADQFERIW